jgi:hypothetical protein
MLVMKEHIVRIKYYALLVLWLEAAGATEVLTDLLSMLLAARARAATATSGRVITVRLI